jgi:CHAT domain-containing protein/tetratricopeptide (TPR) repeat protein
MNVQDELRLQGTEQIEMVAGAEGTDVLSVEPTFNTAAAGSYAIHIAATRGATGDDRSNQEMRQLIASSKRLRDAGKVDESQSFLERALATGERVRGPDDAEVAMLVADLGGIALGRRDYVKAEALYKRALGVLERTRGPGHPHTALVMNHLGVVYFHLGQRPTAEKLLQQSLALTEAALGPDHLHCAFVLLGLASLRHDAGDLEKAEAFHRRGLAIAEKVEGSEGSTVGLFLNNLGINAMGKRDYDQAREFYLRALRIAEVQQGKDSYTVATTLQNLGIIEREKKDYPKAEEYYLRALAIRERTVGADHQDIAANLTNLANIYRLKGDIPRSLETHFRALSIWENSGPYNRGTLMALGNIARNYAASGDAANALAFQQRVDAVIETQLALNLAIGSERQKLAYVDSVAERTHRTISLSLEAGPGEAEASALGALVLLQRKGRVLDVMTDTVGVLRQRIADNSDRNLLDERQQTTTRLAQLVLNGPQMMAVGEYKKAIQGAEERKEKLEGLISDHSAEFRAQSQVVTLKTVQAAIPRDVALIELAVFRPFNAKAESNDEAYGDPHYVAYVIVKDRPARGKDLGPAAEIDKAVDALRAALRHPARSDVKQLARAVDERVMQPVRTMLGSEKRLLISPDGALNLIPFEALVDEQRRYAVQRYSISYLTSGRDLLRLQVPRVSKGEPVVIADPVFGEPPIGTAGDATGKPSTRRRSITTTDNLTNVYFAPLPGTAQEARAIKTLFRGTRVLSRQQATKAALVELNAPRILHIATHGFFLRDPVNPVVNPLLRSGLALSGANLHKSSNSDGLFTALEASTLNLWGTKLVTLSACDTGVGEVRNGEGVYGLRRAFFLAGAETLVMSLWPVSDYLTREMMTAYYGGLKQGLGRGEALRQAQLSMLARKDRQHPFHWAGFIQAGEWASLDGQR